MIDLLRPMIDLLRPMIDLLRRRLMKGNPYQISEIPVKKVCELAGNLDNITNTNNKELGGFVKLLICSSLLELGGRILLAEKSHKSNEVGDQMKVNKLHSKAIKKMLEYLGDKTANLNYKDNKDDFVRYRNGLAHMLIPAGEFMVGEDANKQHFSKDDKKLFINDEQLIKDLKTSFKELVKLKSDKFRIIVSNGDPLLINWEVKTGD